MGQAQGWPPINRGMWANSLGFHRNPSWWAKMGQISLHFQAVVTSRQDGSMVECESQFVSDPRSCALLKVCGTESDSDWSVFTRSQSCVHYIIYIINRSRGIRMVSTSRRPVKLDTTINRITEISKWMFFLFCCQ